MKKVWVIHKYATTLDRNGLHRPSYFANILKDHYEFTIFTASYQHYANENLIIDKKEYMEEVNDGTKYVFINTCSSKRGVSSRIKQMIQFSKKVIKIASLYEEKIGKPDVIYASSPDLMVLGSGLKLAKKMNVPCICEVRDLWPENLFTSMKYLNSKSLVGRYLISKEHKYYKNADAMVFLKEGDTDYLKERGWCASLGGDIDISKCYYINNGVDLDCFYSSAEKYYSKIKYKNKFIVTYVGAIRKLNNIFLVIEAAKKLLSVEDVEFHIYGTGNEVDRMNQIIREENLTNVFYEGYVDTTVVPAVLCKSSVNLLIYGDRYNWSRGNSSNKLFEYMASGRPIISSVKMGYSLLKRYNCGIELEVNSAQNLADAIMEIKNLNKEEYDIISNNAKKAAQQFDYKILGQKLEEVIENVTGE